MDGEGARSNGCAIGVRAPRVDGPRKPNFWCSGTQERLRNGSRNGRETLEPVASASLIGHPPSWEVPLVSDKEPRRVVLASSRVPERPSPPRLYDAPRARTRARAHAPAARREAGRPNFGVL
jgi:hypothetical protein